MRPSVSQGLVFPRRRPPYLGLHFFRNFLCCVFINICVIFTTQRLSPSSSRPPRHSNIVSPCPIPWPRGVRGYDNIEGTSPRPPTTMPATKTTSPHNNEPSPDVPAPSHPPSPTLTHPRPSHSPPPPRRADVDVHTQGKTYNTRPPHSHVLHEITANVSKVNTRDFRM